VALASSIKFRQVVDTSGSNSMPRFSHALISTPLDYGLKLTSAVVTSNVDEMEGFDYSKIDAKRQGVAPTLCLVFSQSDVL
jgi:hypothetical protein